MKEFNLTMSDEQYESLKKFAKADFRSMAATLRYSMHQKANTAKKKDEDGNIIKFPLDNR